MRKNMVPAILGFSLILVAGFLIYMIPYWEAKQRNAAEAEYIDAYLDQYQENAWGEERSKVWAIPDEMDSNASLTPEEGVKYAFSDTDSSAYQGTIDRILVIDKINLKKAIIRGEHNDSNLENYYFVTADQEAVLSQDNYVIYGHCSQTYGHSFNRLEANWNLLSKGEQFFRIEPLK